MNCLPIRWQRKQARPLDPDALDFIERNPVLASVIELRRSGRDMPRDFRGHRQVSACGHVRRHAGCPKRVIADQRRVKSSSLGAPLRHLEGCDAAKAPFG